MPQSVSISSHGNGMQWNALYLTRAFSVRCEYLQTSEMHHWFISVGNHIYFKTCAFKIRKYIVCGVIREIGTKSSFQMPPWELEIRKYMQDLWFYRWPRNDVIPMTRFWCRWQQTAKTTTNHTAQCNDLCGLSWTASIIMCIIAVVASIDIWVWSWCRTCIKESFTKLVWQIKSRNCWRWAGQMSVSASGWSVHWEWEQPTQWPNLAWGDLTLDISGKYGLLWEWSLVMPKMFDRIIKLTRVV